MLIRKLIREDFRYWIVPLPEEESEGSWDWRVTVQNRVDGRIKETKVSGGYVVAESYATQLAWQLGMPKSIHF